MSCGAPLNALLRRPRGPRDRPRRGSPQIYTPCARRRARSGAARGGGDLRSRAAASCSSSAAALKTNPRVDPETRRRSTKAPRHLRGTTPLLCWPGEPSPQERRRHELRGVLRDGPGGGRGHRLPGTRVHDGGQGAEERPDPDALRCHTPLLRPDRQALRVKGHVQQGRLGAGAAPHAGAVDGEPAPPHPDPLHHRHRHHHHDAGAQARRRGLRVRNRKWVSVPRHPAHHRADRPPPHGGVPQAAGAGGGAGVPGAPRGPPGLRAQPGRVPGRLRRGGRGRRRLPGHPQPLGGRGPRPQRHEETRGPPVLVLPLHRAGAADVRGSGRAGVPRPQHAGGPAARARRAHRGPAAAGLRPGRRPRPRPGPRPGAGPPRLPLHQDHHPPAKHGGPHGLPHLRHQAPRLTERRGRHFEPGGADASLVSSAQYTSNVSHGALPQELNGFPETTKIEFQ